MRQGDFSGLATIYDPNSAGGTGQRQPLPNNEITRLDPVAVAMLARIPFPNESV